MTEQREVPFKLIALVCEVPTDDAAGSARILTEPAYGMPLTRRSFPMPLGYVPSGKSACPGMYLGGMIQNLWAEDRLVHATGVVFPSELDHDLPDRLLAGEELAVICTLSGPELSPPDSSGVRRLSNWVITSVDVVAEAVPRWAQARIRYAPELVTYRIGNA